MTAPTASGSARKARPLSPHLQIYKPQMTTGMSIFHRMTGMALSVALPAFVWWLVVLAQGPEAYGQFLGCMHSLIGQIVLFGFSWAFFFHFCSGIRHLFWDMGLFLDIKKAYMTGYVALVVSTAMTALFWATIWGCV